MIGLLNSVGGVGIYHIGKTITDPIFTFMTVLENVFNRQVYQRMFGQYSEGSDAIGMYLTPFLYISTFISMLIAYFPKRY